MVTKEGAGVGINLTGTNVRKRAVGVRESVCEGEEEESK
jgi:hypothetical protein